jgi:DNA mismatch repair protein MutS
VVVKEWNDEIIFLRSIESGPSDKSYGIHVAKLAGMPPWVIQRANEVLGFLESEGNVIQNSLQKKKKIAFENNQMDLEI